MFESAKKKKKTSMAIETKKKRERNSNRKFQINFTNNFYEIIEN